MQLIIVSIPTVYRTETMFGSEVYKLRLLFPDVWVLLTEGNIQTTVQESPNHSAMQSPTETSTL